METFAVVAVIDGNTLDVSPGWELENRTGKGAMAAEQKLSILIQNKKVELGSPRGIERGRLVCEVYFQGRNLADYLPEYKEQESEAPDKLED